MEEKKRDIREENLVKAAGGSGSFTCAYCGASIPLNAPPTDAGMVRCPACGKEIPYRRDPRTRTDHRWG